MRRYVPEVRALYERVRRPAISILVGLGLMAPLGASFLRPATPEAAAATAAEVGPAESATAASSAPESVATVPATTAESRSTESGADDSGTTEAAKVVKSEKAAEKEPAAARFANQFKIPVPLAEQIHNAAVAEGIEPRVAFGLVQTESSFRRTAISSVGAVGYTQLLPSTANWIAPGTTRSQLFQPQTNLRVGFKYLNYLKDKYNGNMRLALTAYNRGPGTVDRLLKQGRNPENGYATKVLRARG